MAERPDLGNVYGNLQAAIDATKGKAKAAVDEVERLADEREKALKDAEANAERDVAREVERGGRKKAVRSEGAQAAERESAAIEASDRSLVRETGALNANTAAWNRRNTAVRESTAANAQAARSQATPPIRYGTGAVERTAAQEEARRAQLRPGEGGYRYPGALQGTALPPLGYTYQGERAPRDPTFWPSTLGPRERGGFLSEKFPARDADELRLWQEATGRTAPGEPVGGPFLTGGIGERTLTLQQDDPKRFAKYAKAAGWTKAAAKARKEELKAAVQEAKGVETEAQSAATEIAASEQKIAAASAPAAAPRPQPAPERGPLVAPVAQAEKVLQSQAATIRSLTTAQRKTLEEIEAGQTEFSGRKRKTLEALSDKSLIRYTEPELDPSRYDARGEAYAAGGSGRSGPFTDVRRVPPAAEVKPAPPKPVPPELTDAEREAQIRQARGIPAFATPVLGPPRAPAEYGEAAAEAAAYREEAQRAAAAAPLGKGVLAQESRSATTFASRNLGAQAATIRNLTDTQLKTLREIEAGTTEFSAARHKTLDALTAAGLIETTRSAETPRVISVKPTAGAPGVGSAEGRAAFARQAVAKQPVGLTPEEQYAADLAEQRRQTLGGVRGDLGPAIRATKAPEPVPEPEPRFTDHTAAERTEAKRAAREAEREQAAAAKRVAAEEVETRKAAETRQLEDQRAFESRSLAEAEAYGARRLAILNASEGRLAAAREGAPIGPVARAAPLEGEVTGAAEAEALAARRRAIYTEAEGSLAGARESAAAAGGGRRPPPQPPVALGGAGAGGGGDGEDKIRRVTAAREADAQAAARSINLTHEEATARTISNQTLERNVANLAGSSQQLQRHGALTAEFVQALGRGEVTLREFESQLVTTIGKFAGWAVAGGLVYGAYDAIKHLFDGVTETQSGVAQLKRTLGERVNVPAAEEGFRKEAGAVNVSIREVADAQFYSARVFHDQRQSLELAGTALRAFKLDNVNTQDAIKAFGAVSVAFGLGPRELGHVFDMLDVGQLKFNARLQQTLPQMGRAAASFAAAGGTARELAEQLIEINRATGGGGGTGGGNPATALLREPANLTRPESEETIRRVLKLDPKWAREHIGAFNRYVQEQNLTEEQRQEVAKAAGAGAGVGFRYLLPLYRLGSTSIPREVSKEVGERAEGSAAEDLKHKLEQLDEQFKKLGVEFEITGSKIGSGGVGHALSDVVGTLNLGAQATTAVIDPFARLAGALSNLPGPLRLAAEAAAAFFGIKALSGTGVGLTAQRFATESKFIPYAGGDALAVKSIAATQRTYVKKLQDEYEAASVQGVRIGRQADVAYQRLNDFRALPVPIDQEAREAHESKEGVLARRSEQLTERQLAQDEEITALNSEIIERKAVIAQLEDKSILAKDKALIAEEAGLGGRGLYGAQLGAPNVLPFYTPRSGIPTKDLRAKQPLEDLRVAGGVTEADLAAFAASASLVQRVRTASERSIQGLNQSGALGGVLARSSERLTGAASGIFGFFKGLGLLGKGIAAFAALDIGEQLLGVPKELEQTQSRLDALRHPNTLADLERATSGTHNRDLADYLKEGAQYVVTGITHPKQAIEQLGSALGLGGEEHPELFDAAAQKQAEEYRDLRKKELASHKLKFPGEGGAGSEVALAEYETLEEGEVAQLSSTDTKKAQGAEANIQKALKLRLDQLKQFGGSLGIQSIQYLTSQLGSESSQYLLTGSEQVFEELVKNDELVTQGVIKDAQAKADLAYQFARTTKQIAGIGAGQEGEINALVVGEHLRIRHGREELGSKGEDLEKNFAKYRAQPNQRTKATEYTALVQQSKELGDYKNRLANEEVAGKTDDQLAQAGREVGHQKKLAALLAAPRRAATLRVAQAGSNQEAKALIELKLAQEEEEATVNALRGDPGASSLDAVNAARAKKIAAEENLATAQLGKLQRQGQLKIAELPAGSSPQTRAQQEQANAAAEKAHIEASHLPKAAKEGLLEAAQLNNANATKALAESNISESHQLSQLATQIAEARDAGNARAQAADAAAGAARSLAEARNPVERRQAELEGINAANQAQQTAESHLADVGTLEESRTADPIKRDRIKIHTLRKQIAIARPDEKIKLEADYNNERRKLVEDKATEAEDETKFLLHTHQLTNDQAVRRLQRVLRELKSQHAPKSKIRSTESEIYDLLNETQQDFDVGSIRQPTLYGARTLRGLISGGQNVSFHQQAPVPSTPAVHLEANITIVSPDGHKKSVHRLHRVAHTTNRAHARSAGVR